MRSLPNPTMQPLATSAETAFAPALKSPPSPRCYNALFHITCATDAANLQHYIRVLSCVAGHSGEL